jgi:glycerol-3-phosphate O-acyltransferase/dihydroxyacetone phosphate acyltransferase
MLSTVTLTVRVVDQFLDMLVALEVHKETRRKVRFLVAAASMRRGAIGAFARLISSSELILAFS